MTPLVWSPSSRDLEPAPGEARGWNYFSDSQDLRFYDGAGHCKLALDTRDARSAGDVIAWLLAVVEAPWATPGVVGEFALMLARVVALRDLR